MMEDNRVVIAGSTTPGAAQYTADRPAASASSSFVFQVSLIGNFAYGLARS